MNYRVERGLKSAAGWSLPQRQTNAVGRKPRACGGEKRPNIAHAPTRPDN